MTLNDREKFILHLVALMTMQHFGMFKDKTNLHEIVLKNRCRRLKGNDVNKIYEKDLLSRDHPIITADIKDKHLEKLHLTYVVTTDGSISQSSLALENIIDSIRSTGIFFKLTTAGL